MFHISGSIARGAQRLGFLRVCPVLVAASVIAGGAGESVARADDPFVKVIPPGNEKLIGAMLGNDETLADGCKLEGANIDRTRVVAKYSCTGHPAVEVELHHLSDASGSVAKTKQFAIIGKQIPAALLADLTARITAREAPWRWVSAEAPGLGTATSGPTLTTADPSSFTPEQSEVFVAGVKLYREQKYAEAFDAFVKLAHETPQHGVLGMIVASLASTIPDRAQVTRYTAAADASPDDTLAQFIAGVAAHYCGHRKARTIAEKQELYQTAIKYLTRTRPKFDFEPRVYVYLAVSQFRLGHEEEAQKLIEQAVPLATNDPDVYYCRAEIFQKANLVRSIEDIKTYLSMEDKLHAQGVQVNETKQKRVQDMKASLEAVAAGKAKLPPNDQLFDPLEELLAPSTNPVRANAGAPAHRAFKNPRMFAAATLGAGLLAGFLWLVLARRSRQPSA